MITPILVFVTEVSTEGITFSNGYSLSCYHEQECCDDHYLDFTALDIDDFKGLVFNLASTDFLGRIPNFGVDLIPINGHPVKVAGYGSQNGYYSDNLCIRVFNVDQLVYDIDITDCQDYEPH